MFHHNFRTGRSTIARFRYIHCNREFLVAAVRRDCPANCYSPRILIVRYREFLRFGITEFFRIRQLEHNRADGIASGNRLRGVPAYKFHRRHDARTARLRRARHRGTRLHGTGRTLNPYRDGIPFRKLVKRVGRFRDGKPDNAILDSRSQIVDVQPLDVVAIAFAAHTVAVVRDNRLPAHRSPCLCPREVIVVVATDAALVTLRATARGKQVVYLTLVELAVPRLDIVVQPRGNIDRNLCVGECRLDGRHDAVEIVAGKGIVRNAAALLRKRGIDFVARFRVLDKVRLNQPDGRIRRSVVLRDALRIRTVTIDDVVPARADCVCAVCAVIVAPCAHVAVPVSLVLVVFGNHVGVYYRSEASILARTHHGAFPTFIVGIVIA